ncbi:MAG: site-specific DNA-methyltransferase, partial [Methylococcales bacterium]
MEKLNLHSPDFTQANIAKLAELFPNCVTETREADGALKKAIDFDQLRQELSTSIVEGPQERYQLNWPGKREALLTANAAIAKTLRPSREESEYFDTTQNLFIEGDNLDVLKLLQETYLGKVKMIYIDPPYNTGNDFIYEDDFAEDTEAYLERSNQKDEIGNRMVANTESNGRFHSDWLTMIYSRIKLTINLLKDDGLMAISIDDTEIANLLHVVDELFGWKNRKVVCVKMSEPSGLKMGSVKRLGTIPKIKEYLVLCGKNGVRGLNLERIQKESWDNEYNIFIDGLTREDRESIRTISEKEVTSEADVALLDQIGDRIRLVSVADKLRENSVSASDREKWLF